MTGIQKQRYGLIALVVVLAILTVYPQKTRECHITQKGPITHIGQGFDGGFVEIQVGSTIFDNPVINAPSSAGVSLPPHLKVGEYVEAAGEWTATGPWWQFQRPAPPKVVKLTRFSLVRPAKSSHKA